MKPFLWANEMDIQYLREVLDYDPETGIFTWRKSQGRAKSGSTAGSMHCRGYLGIRVNKKRYLVHRLAWMYMTGAMPVADIDHINGIKTDNRFANLRSVTHRTNKRNTALYKNNKSGFHGISFDARWGKWYASINADDRKIFLGYFTNILDAREARLIAEAEHGYHQNHGRKPNGQEA